jgi:hypothetical protein
MINDNKYQGGTGFYTEEFGKEETVLWDNRRKGGTLKHEEKNHRNSSFHAGDHCCGVCDKYQCERKNQTNID